MNRAIATLMAAAVAAGVATGCTGHVYVGDLPRSHRAAIVGADSSCDSAGAGEHRDPASHCYIDRRKAKD